MQRLARLRQQEVAETASSTARVGYDEDSDLEEDEDVIREGKSIKELRAANINALRNKNGMHKYFVRLYEYIDQLDILQYFTTVTVRRARGGKLGFKQKEIAYRDARVRCEAELNKRGVHLQRNLASIKACTRCHDAAWLTKSEKLPGIEVNQYVIAAKYTRLRAAMKRQHLILFYLHKKSVAEIMVARNASRDDDPVEYQTLTHMLIDLWTTSNTPVEELETIITGDYAPVAVEQVLSFASYDAAANSTLWHNPKMKNYLYLNNDPTQFPEQKRWRAHVNGSKNVELRLLLSQCWTRLQTDMDSLPAIVRNANQRDVDE